MSESLTLRTELGDERMDLEEFEARVRRGEVSPHSLVQLPAVTAGRFVPACELELFRQLHQPRRASFTRAFALARFPTVTVGLLLLELAVYVLVARRGPLELDALVRAGGKAAPLILDVWEVWRLQVANLLHRDALHIGLNLFVLFNVGGALENVYRRLDYALILLVSGLGTMASSLWLSDAVTVGASGMVYGCLGALAAFGLRFRTILPERYRHLLGEAALPTVLLFLWIGWTSVGVDNAAHMGGLLTGGVLGALLRPRLLREPRPEGRGELWRWGAVGAAALLPWVATAALSGVAPATQEVGDDTVGVHLRVPQTWRRTADAFGPLAFTNGLPGAGSASVSVDVLAADAPVDALAGARRFVEERLVPSALGEDVLAVTPQPAQPTQVAEREAIEVRARVARVGLREELRAVFVPRGDWLVRLVVRHDAATPAYGPVLEAVVASLRLEEPRALREARARALLLPHTAASLGRLGRALRMVGEPLPAVTALRVAVARAPSEVDWRTSLTQALLEAGQPEAACAEAEGAILYAPQASRPFALAAQCELARGRPQRALERIEEALARDPTDARLKLAHQHLRVLVEASGP